MTNINKILQIYNIKKLDQLDEYDIYFSDICEFVYFLENFIDKEKILNYIEDHRLNV